MKRHSINLRAKRMGFTLIEVALAVTVAGVGVLGLFALISTGLDASAKAVATTQAAFFADASLNALRAEAVQAAQATNWANFWDPFAAGTTTLTVAAPAAWVPGPALNVHGDGALYEITFLNNPLHAVGSSASKIPTGSLRYKMKVTKDPTSARHVQRVSLQVWPGTGNAPKDKDALVFYSEYPDVGNL